jgi:hypothetical protein
MTTIRAVLVGVVVAAAMVVAIRHVPVEEQKADAAISIETLRGVGLMRAAAVIQPPKVEKPMVLPPLEPIPPPPKIDLPARPAPPPPKIAPPDVREGKRRPLRVADVCAAHGFRRIQHGLSWHCSRW